MIPPATTRYVHHILVYLCSNLNHTHVGARSECEDVNIDIGLCRGGGIFIAVWAVGGEVSTLHALLFVKVLIIIAVMLSKLCTGFCVS